MNALLPARPSETPLDALLASYAVGRVSRPLHALIASHLSLSPSNRGFVRSLENALANDIALSAPVRSDVHNRDARLSNIFSDQAAEETVPAAASSTILPSPLAAYIGQSFEDVKWQNVMPGLREAKFEDRAGCEASLLWIKGGRAMPSHTHPGIEATLVLKGSFTDSQGCFARGDMAVVDSAVDHKPIAGDEEDCICFAVSEGPVHLTGPLARIYNWMKRH